MLVLAQQNKNIISLFRRINEVQPESEFSGHVIK